MLTIKGMQGLGSGLLPANGNFISESSFSFLFCGAAPSGRFVVGLVPTILALVIKGGSLKSFVKIQFCYVLRIITLCMYILL